jgi:hypothetical protein
VPGRRDVESYESVVIQGWWPDSRRVTDVDEREPRTLRRSKLHYPSDLTDDEWKLVELLIPPGRPGGGKRTVIMRESVNLCASSEATVLNISKHECRCWYRSRGKLELLFICEDLPRRFSPTSSPFRLR